VQSRMYTRRPRFPPTKSKGKAPLNPLSSADEASDDESPSFLPFSTVDDREGTNDRDKNKGKGIAKNFDDPTATLRRYSQRPATRPNLEQVISPSSSGTLSSPPQPSSSVQSISSPRGIRSPNNSNVLATLSPRQRRIAKEGSEGTPSMGSSFSDLDDASISQSAMEEALAREIKAGKGSLSVVSRMGGLWRQAGGGGQGR
jgi:hypothetical protein